MSVQARQLPSNPELLGELAELCDCGQRTLALAILPQVGGVWVGRGRFCVHSRADGGPALQHVLVGACALPPCLAAQECCPGCCPQALPMLVAEGNMQGMEQLAQQVRCARCAQQCCV